jgi:hypothetical protein
MTEPSQPLTADWLALFSSLTDELRSSNGPEAALSVLTRTARDFLGDLTAGGRAGALEEGELDYRVTGVFLISPDRRHNVLVANQGFPVEQRRLSIPIAWNTPGQVVAKERFVLLENTNEHAEFRQFLKTSRMGSSIYMPIFAEHGMIGQIVAASQARWTYGTKDIAPIFALAGLAAVVWETNDGEGWWAQEHPTPDAWYAEEQSL